MAKKEKSVKRVAIVGFGFMGRMHYGNWKKVKGAKVVALCDKDTSQFTAPVQGGNLKGADASIDFGEALIYDDFDRMLREAKPDVISLTLPTPLHVPLTIKALQAGVSVLCEKPMALDAAACGKMIEAAKKAPAGTRLMIAQCLRFWPSYVLLKRLVDSQKYGKVIACPASPPHYQHNPIKTIKTSVLGAIHCLGLAKRTGARVFQASTSEVYGDPEVHPQPESYNGSVNPIGIRACYDEGKRCAETLFFDYHRQNKVDIRVVRIFNTYGPRMLPDDGRVVSNFIVQALRGADLTIYGDGLQTRSFCYVDDLIEGFLRLMNHPTLVGPVNLGNPGEFTMLQLAELVLAKVGGPSKITYLALPGDDPKQRQPDITLAHRELGWSPTIQLEQGLDATIAYFRKLLLG